MSTWSPFDDQSTKSWGTPYVSPTSPTVTWGTLSPSASSSSYTVVDHNTPWSPKTVVSSPQGWASNASSPLYPSLSNPASAGSYGGYPSPPISSTPGRDWTQIQLNPLLDSRSHQCLDFDIGALQFMPNVNLNGPAVHPPVTFIQLLIVVPPFKWSMNIHLHGSVTVSQVVQHIFEYLQGYENAYDLQKSKVQQIPSGHSQNPYVRDQVHPNGFHSGKRRIDLLGPHRRFRGLSPGPNHAWVVHLLDR